MPAAGLLFRRRHMYANDVPVQRAAFRPAVEYAALPGAGSMVNPNLVAIATGSRTGARAPRRVPLVNGP
jgi:hypothetical protein